MRIFCTVQICVPSAIKRVTTTGPNNAPKASQSIHPKKKNNGHAACDLHSRTQSVMPPQIAQFQRLAQSSVNTLAVSASQSHDEKLWQLDCCVCAVCVWVFVQAKCVCELFFVCRTYDCIYLHTSIHTQQWSSLGLGHVRRIRNTCMRHLDPDACVL